MDWIIMLTVIKTALCFNIDPAAWRSWSNGAEGFGYQVVQRTSDLLVSAPLAQYNPFGRGEIYKCSPSSCKKMQIQVPEFAVNMSLGLTMTSDPDTQRTVVCGPTIPKDCRSITMYYGACFQISRSDAVRPLVPPSSPECRAEADIAFLLDGSGSVSDADFAKMKTFVKKLVGSFVGKDTQFSVTQFSWNPQVHYYFKNFFSSGDWETDINNIRQIGGGTHTAKAIKYVVQNVFTAESGSRSNVKKVLIVITDGASQDRDYLGSAASLAEGQKIVRFAIGVGQAFTNADARQELNTIASSPAANHMFQVAKFEALEGIRNSLQDKIFAIEGSQSSGDSLKMEMAQEGFSAAFAPEGIQMGIVGANQWKGGFLQYTLRGQSLRSYEPANMEPDSYLGYSMAVAISPYGTLTIAGAPRHKHRGVVVAVQRNIPHTIDPFPWQHQTGEYFGAAVCAMDVNGDRYTDLILISAPMYKDTDREGRVYACSLNHLNVECHFDAPLMLRGVESDGGRFGASLAVLPDLNADGLNDLAVGAPLESDGQGSIYIFHGEGGGRISPTFSQRIAASEVQRGLRYFGVSISQSSYDQSGDNLPDLAVGSKGNVVVLRSKPVVMVEVEMSFHPGQIPTQNNVCLVPLENTARFCFTMTRLSTVELSSAQAKINYTLTLDATRKVPNNRAYIVEKQRESSGSITLSTTGPQCVEVKFSIDACPEDVLNALNNELRFTFDGLPSNTNLKPSLAQQAKTTTFHPLGFELNCGVDNMCVDNLKVDFNFTRSLEVKVGIDELLNVTVSVENTEENSYNSQIVLTYPDGLSFRKFTTLQGRIECNSLDSEDGIMQGMTTCSINEPIFQSNTQAVFIVSYGIETNRELDRRIYITANATSQNQVHSSSSDLYRRKGIDVKYSIFVTMESSLSYSNFTFGKNNLLKPLQNSLLVTNNIRALNLTVVIMVPVKLGDKDIWEDSSSFEIPHCQEDALKEPRITDFVSVIQKSKNVDCSVATCRVFRCSRFMGRQSVTYEISGNLSSGWIQQIGLESAKFLLTSTASLEYDTNQYIFFSTGADNKPPLHRIEAEIQVYPQPDFTKEIVGGLLGGLVLLALLTAGLYKAGFFKSKYQAMMNDGEGGTEATADEDAAAPEPET